MSRPPGPEPAAASTEGATTLDGFTLGQLPDGLGPLVSDFDYESDDVTFRTRVWERGPDTDGKYSVDLQIWVLRGDRLTDPAALRDFLAEYLGHDPQDWALERYDRDTYHGFIASGRVFFLVQPGVAVQVSAEGGTVDSAELLATANRIQPTPR
ncbi:MAG: hypothetical protein ABR608_14525 [Pseudonocardiaceae bacterium]